jgi:hypothetical protein
MYNMNNIVIINVSKKNYHHKQVNMIYLFIIIYYYNHIKLILLKNFF